MARHVPNSRPRLPLTGLIRATSFGATLLAIGLLAGCSGSNRSSLYAGPVGGEIATSTSVMENGRDSGTSLSGSGGGGGGAGGSGGAGSASGSATSSANATVVVDNGSEDGIFTSAAKFVDSIIMLPFRVVTGILHPIL